MITAAMLTADHVITQHPGARCYLLNDGDITADMAGVDFVESSPTIPM